MLTPEGFAEAVVPHGTGATVSDPHEIVNVLGLKGLAYMQKASAELPMDIFWTLPSCVPATDMESAGARLDSATLAAALADHPDLTALSEMMNFPGVLHGAPDVLRKIRDARSRGMIVDGHSPGLTGEDLNGYVAAGITTDHECLGAAEAKEKLRRGMWVLMREGSAAKNLRDLLPAVTEQNLHRVCIASDDRHPDDLVREGHLDHSLRIAVANGLDPLWAVRMVTLNPAQLYGLDGRGGIAPSYRADLVVLEDLKEFRIRSVYHGGVKVAENDTLLVALRKHVDEEALSSVHLPDDLGERLRGYPEKGRVRVIGVEPDQIVTRHEVRDASEAGPGRPLQFAAVAERHGNTGSVGLGFVEGFDLAEGAMASTVAHDSHNLVMVGATPEEMRHAAEVVAKMGGGFAVVCGGEVLASLPLSVGGLMSRGRASELSEALGRVHEAVGSLHCSLPAPFMTLSFIALPVIPSLKLTDRGLVDVEAFDFVSLSAEG